MSIRLVFSILFLVIITACGKPETSPKKLPNIVVIFTDDHGYSDLGIMGIKDDVRTPHIDALARRGVLMTQGYVSAPTCVPSRAGLLTGRYQNTFGLDTNIEFRDPVVRNKFLSLETIAEKLSAAGYATGMSGKWHLGSNRKVSDHGFKFFWVTDGKNDKKNFEETAFDLSPELIETGYHIDQSSAFASAFIEKNKDQPFFFYWAPRAPHVPLDAPQPYLDRFEHISSSRRQQGLAMISAVDDGVGQIVKSLKDNRILDNTLIIFISDNGAPLRIDKREDGPVFSGWDGSLNDPLNGEKSLLMEGGIRVPFIVSWPAQIPSGELYKRPVTSLDATPTIYAAAGLKSVANLPGRDLSPFLTGKKSGDPHENLFWKFADQRAIRSGDWKLIRFLNRTYLYDLSRDQEEESNLFEKRPDRAAALSNLLDDWVSALPAIPVTDKTKVKNRAKRRSLFYDHYLDGKLVDTDKLYLDWVYNMSVDDLSRKSGTQIENSTLPEKD